MIQIRAPLDLVTELGTIAHIRFDGDSAIQLLAESCELRLDLTAGYYVGDVALLGPPHLP